MCIYAASKYQIPLVYAVVSNKQAHLLECNALPLYGSRAAKDRSKHSSVGSLGSACCHSVLTDRFSLTWPTSLEVLAPVEHLAKHGIASCRRALL